ncbi:MAG TPA: hypothetical protein DHV28_00950 [Ignavibacteriales bacterium]|nr:hypothetical protein [Ignavibacteriales bacterium]
MNVKLGIIIVTYNSQNDIIRLLDSILIQDYSDLIIYIVDNNSSDNTLNLIKNYNTQFSIVIIATGVNNGYAAGNNIGIKRAIDDGCEFLFILNPDMQLQKKCIPTLINRILGDEKLAVIGPVVLFGNNHHDTIQDFGVKANFKTQRKDDLFSNKKLTDQIPIENYVDLLLGGAMMIRSNVIRLTGMFEENYFMYNDELDLAYRINKTGLRTLCLRDARVMHFHDFDKKNIVGNNLMYYYIMRNKYLYFKKYKLYKNLWISLINEVFIFPLKILWALQRMGNIKILKFYYLGLIDGLKGKKGKSNILFN